MKNALVELHDVTPYYRDEILSAIKFLEKVEIKKYSLLIIPHFWSLSLISSDKSFIETLDALKQEKVLHGFTHKGPKSLKYKLWTEGEGEFANLSLKETKERIKRALRVFKEIGFETNFFVPPAWIGNRFLEFVLKSYGFLGVAYRNKIKDLERGQEVWSPVLTFSNRTFLSLLSIKIGPLYLKFLKNFPLIRIALHAKDFRDKRKVKLWHSILSQIKKERRIVGYAELFSQS